MKRLFKDFIEVLNWIDKFSKQLNENGDTLYSQYLLSALQIGGTSSELLGAVRYQLIFLTNQKIPKKYKVQKEFKEIIKMINSALGSPPK